MSAYLLAGMTAAFSFSFWALSSSAKCVHVCRSVWLATLVWMSFRGWSASSCHQRQLETYRIFLAQQLKVAELAGSLDGPRWANGRHARWCLLRSIWEKSIFEEENDMHGLSSVYLMRVHSLLQMFGQQWISTTYAAEGGLGDRKSSSCGQTGTYCCLPTT